MELTSNDDEAMQRSTEGLFTEVRELFESTGDEGLRGVADAGEGDGEGLGGVEPCDGGRSVIIC